jgi:N6-adenosine-specific RNA methylase IME4
MSKIARAVSAALTADTAARLLFDKKPFEIDGFMFYAQSVEALGAPTPAQWQAAYLFAEACGHAADYWIGDLLAYAENRADWQEKASQIMGVSTLARQTLRNRTYISKHVQPPERAMADSLGHADAVAPMEVAQQRIWLEKSKREGWSVSELRTEIRASKRRAVVKGQAKLEGLYRVIYADPPWRYRNTSGTGGNSSVKHHYPDMSIEELCKLPVAAHTLKNAVLFMWVTVPLMFENPGPREVLEAWGFEYASMQTWDKVLGNPGRFLHINTEHLIIAERGSCAPDRGEVPKSLFTERRTEHSVKPAVTRKMIERMYETGPFLELFAREKVEGWDAFGNDPNLW